MFKRSNSYRFCFAVVLLSVLILLPSCKKDQPCQTVEPAGTDTQQTDQTPGEPGMKESEEAPEAADTGLAPVEIPLPRPMFVGTPQNIRIPGGAKLEKPSGKQRGPFLAPKGVTNVAFGKPVTSTEEFPVIGELEMITDGDKEAADGSYVDLGPFLQNVTIDLEKECEIYAIVLWHYHKQARAYFDVIVQVSNDPEFVEGVTTVFNNDIDNSVGVGVGKDLHYIETSEGKLIDAKGVKGRYVRLYSNGNSSDESNHYIEVDVYGIPFG